MKQTQEKIDEWSEVQEPREDVNYVKWETEGTEVKGVLKEVFEGKECKFAKVDTGANLLTMFSVPAILDGKLSPHVGKEVKVVYIGKVKFKSGRFGKDFKVFVKGDGTPAKGEGKPSPQNHEAYV